MNISLNVDRALKNITYLVNNMRILFDSKKEQYKKPFGCVNPGEKCTLHIYIPAECKTETVRLYIFDEMGFEMLVPFEKITKEKGYEQFETTFSLFKTGLYFYYFKIETEETDFSLYKVGNDTNIEEGGFWQITCYDTAFSPADGFAGRVMYQIFPDRFAIAGSPDLSDKLKPYTLHSSTEEQPEFKPDENGKVLNNDFFGGNLEGIRRSLHYIKKLGVGLIYLNPIFMAYSNHRYDTADYKRIDPMLGTEEDFVRLCNDAHLLDIKIILDGVFSHTGSNSRYFDKNGIFGGGAYSDKNSPFCSWYDFQTYPDKYTSWWGIDTLPCVNELDKSYMDFIIFDEDSVIKHWLNLGADGFRLDVVDEIPDEFVLALKREMKKTKPESFLIGEVWEDASNKISYGIRRRYFSDSELDSVMNYPFRDAVISLVKGDISGVDFMQRIMTLVENYPQPVLNCLMNMLSTHDTGRILTLLGKNPDGMTKEEQAAFKLEGEELEKAICLEKIAAVLQFTLPGMPCIYYGDEIGMEGFGDPFCRGFFRWDKVNRELSEYYCALCILKNKSLALKHGKIQFGSCGENFVTFRRISEKETLEIKVTIGENAGKSGASLFSFSSAFGSADISILL